MELYKYEYELGSDKMRWKACILADTSEEGFQFLRKILTGSVNLYSIEHVCHIDGVSDEVVKRVAASYNDANAPTLVTAPVNNPNVDHLYKQPKLDLAPKKTRMKRTK